MATNLGTDLLCDVLRNPNRLSSISQGGWELLVRQARCAGLLARVGCMLDAQATLDSVPGAARAHLRSAMALADAQHAEALRELAHVGHALEPAGIEPVLLKDAAYVASGMLPAMGRIFGDIAIMVPKARLGEAEAALMSQGWASTHHSAYDQRYYRQWLHELPPLRHIRRGTVLAVHHSILPDTVRVTPSSAKLLASALPIAELKGFAVLAAPDMVLHGMVGLFHSDDLSDSLRDLSDLDLLLRHLGRMPGFWSDLVTRARELDLARPLYYGLRYTHMRLGTPVPSDASQAAGIGAPGPMMSRLSDALWARALRPQHATASDRWTPAARLALYLRAHWLRMPPVKLVRHLAAKALRLHEAPVTSSR